MQTAGCILATDGASLILDGVRFLGCAAAGVDPENPVWSVGAGFGGAAAVIGDNCMDDATWTDSEGFGCEKYNPVTAPGQHTLMVPSKFLDGAYFAAPAAAISRCEKAAVYGSEGVDASAACCACRWHLQRQILALLAHRLAGKGVCFSRRSATVVSSRLMNLTILTLGVTSAWASAPVSMNVRDRLHAAVTCGLDGGACDYSCCPPPGVVATRSVSRDWAEGIRVACKRPCMHTRKQGNRRYLLASTWARQCDSARRLS